MAKSQQFKRNSSAPSLLDLPQATLVQIAELLPCKDVPSLVCTCKELAGMSACFYNERRSLNMRCFDKVSPKLCMQIIDRFAHSNLLQCFFKCDLSYHSSSSPVTLQAITERFLDNYHCDDEILRDLHSVFTSENSEWFADEPALRPIDVLVHCYLLESLLSSQPTLRELLLDVEFGVFRVPKSKGYRQHWYLMQPFLALQTIQRSCPSLERYGCAKALYQNAAVDMRHVQARFLQNSPQLKLFNIRFGLDKGSLESYRHIKRPLLLEKAVFCLPKWCVWQEDQDELRDFAQKITNVKSVAMVFNARGILKYSIKFLHSLPSMHSLTLRCEFNAGFPSFDIDEGVQMGGFFEGFSLLLSSTVKKLSMLDVPEGEFDMVFSSENIKQYASVEHLRLRFAWSKAELGQKEESRIDGFFDRAMNLQSLCIEGYLRSNRETLVFYKTLSRTSSARST